MNSLVFFNNKGGVGKTTLACNFAHYLVSECKKQVVVVDLDPQCNSTQLMLPESAWEEIYSDPESSPSKTILAPLQGIREGDSSVDGTRIPLRSSRRFKAKIIPGHPAMSRLEDRFSTSWTDFKGDDPGGSRRTFWFRYLQDSLRDLKFDHVVVDVGPSLGALNRSVLIASDFFVTPMAPDLFSLYALDNIAGWFDSWIADYYRVQPSAASALEVVGHEEILPAVLPISTGFVGYTVQQYFTTTRGGERRRIRAYDQHRDEIPQRAAGLAGRSRWEPDDLDLGTVPNMFSMIPLAQGRHAPIAALTSNDGVRGAQVSQRTRYSAQLSAIFETIADRIS